MKAQLLLLSILIIFAILCSPVLAIGKSDLITYYQTAPSSLYYSSDNSDSAYQIIKEKSVQITPTALPITQPDVILFPKLPDSTFLKPFPKPSIPSPHKGYVIRIPGTQNVPASRILTNTEASQMNLTFIQAVYYDPSGIVYEVGFDKTGKGYWVPVQYAPIMV